MCLENYHYDDEIEHKTKNLQNIKYKTTLTYRHTLNAYDPIEQGHIDCKTS